MTIYEKPYYLIIIILESKEQLEDFYFGFIQI